MALHTDIADRKPSHHTFLRIVIVEAWSRIMCVDQTQRFGRALPYSSLTSELVVPAAGPSRSKVTMIESRWIRAEENCMAVAEECSSTD